MKKRSFVGILVSLCILIAISVFTSKANWGKFALLALAEAAVISEGDILLDPDEKVGALYTSTNSGPVTSAPTISTVPVLRSPGAGASNSTIANVSDADQTPNTLMVTVNGGASATQNGVTVSNISIDGSGVVTADVGAVLDARDADFILTVTDNTFLTAVATLPVIVLSECPGVGKWAERAHLDASDGAANDRFGYDVAISGDTVIVGAYLDNTAAGTDAGSAYVFTRTGTVWTQQQHLFASDAEGGDWFGYAIAVSGDTAVIGAPSEDTGLKGAAYVFTRSGTVWTEQQKLTASDRAADDRFGDFVEISGDTVIAAATEADTAGGMDAGAAYVFTRSGTVWTEQQKLTASDGGANDWFGTFIALIDNMVVISARYHDTPAGADAGSAYVFTRSGTVWTQQQEIFGSDSGAGDEFGVDGEISGDSLVVGAWHDDTPAGADAGSAYVFTRSGSLWTEQQKFTAPDGAAGDEFGEFVSISGDTFIAASDGNDNSGGSNAGAAYIYSRSAAVWTEQQKVTASDGAAGDQFGYSVAISGDTAIIGAFVDNTASGSDAGSAYIFNKFCASIQGTITYGNAIGSPAPPRYVQNVTVTGAGSPTVMNTTGTSGTYSLAGFGLDSYTVTPAKPGGSNGAINSFDAGRIAQHVAGLVLLTGNQRAAADVTGNNQIQSFDAAKIAGYVAGLPIVLPNLSGTWRFYTNPVVPFPPLPPSESRTYSSVTSNLTGEDYTAILFGDVSGNWNPATHPRPAGRVNSEQWTVDSESRSGPERGIDIKLPQVAAADKEIVVPVNVKGIANKGIISYEFDLRYDPTVIQPLKNPVDVRGTVSRGLMVVANPNEPGLLRVVVYGAFPIDENGVLLDLRFTAVGKAGSVSPLTWERIMFNEGEPRVGTTNGQIELF